MQRRQPAIFKTCTPILTAKLKVLFQIANAIV
ncbi:hypothetical protein vBEcoMWL3_gp118c [Escherichia phage vB_EcoM_WL-3]|nr:hypothetical protein vBEcoMWL3_gp118c [Escherichia phage vB_EcoM_WL-3]